MTFPRLMLVAAAALATCSHTCVADDTLTIGFTVSRTGKLNNESTAQMRGFELWRDEVKRQRRYFGRRQEVQDYFRQLRRRVRESAGTTALHPHHQPGQSAVPLQPVLFGPGGECGSRFRAARKNHADHRRCGGKDLQAGQQSSVPGVFVGRQQLTRTLKALNDPGMTILLVEQNVQLALALSDYAYVIAEGRRSPKDSLPRWRGDPRSGKPISDFNPCRSPRSEPHGMYVE